MPCFVKDTIKECLADGLGLESGIYEKGSSLTFDLILHIVERFLCLAAPCIIEANFRQHEVVRIETLLEKYGATGLCFAFTGDLDVLYERYKARDKSGQRHWVHKAAESRDSFKQGHLRDNLTGIATGYLWKKILVDTTDFGAVDYEDLYFAAKSFLTSSGISSTSHT